MWHNLFTAYFCGCFSDFSAGFSRPFIISYRSKFSTVQTILGSETQWKAIKQSKDSGLISGAITIHYNASRPDTPTAPEFHVPSTPTVGGHALGKADLTNLTELSVPVSASNDIPTQVTLCVPFFDGGKFLGTGLVTTTVDKTTQSVTVPITNDLSGAGKLNVIFLDADFRPLSATESNVMT